MKFIKPRTKEKTAKEKLRRWMMGAMVMTMVGTTIATGARPFPVEAAELINPADGRHGRMVMYAFDDGGLALQDEHAHLIDQLNYSFALIENGAQVLHDRSVELARDRSIAVEVLSAFTGQPGTIVG